MYKTSMRTDACGNIDNAYLEKQVTVCGWVNKKRDHGNMVFLDIRDREGVVQVFADSIETSEKLKNVKTEDVLRISGSVRKRPDEMINKNMKTGEVEILASEIEIISTSLTPPFVIEENVKASEELRLKYRYLDLRRRYMTDALINRNRIVKAIRDFLSDNGFLEIETPVMSKSTPEGARDYLVPSRIHKGKFYSLVQSPQLYKQILMVSGFDRYFQIARCFRDEDQRADRQPEFTQLDMEMSFVEREDILNIVEGMVSYLFREVLQMEIDTPFEIMTYDEAMNRFGSDKPDLRYGLEINDITEKALKSDSEIMKKNEFTGALILDNEFTRKEIDALIDYVKSTGAGGLGYIKSAGGVKSGTFSKFLNIEMPENGTAFIMSGKRKRTLEYLGMLRRQIASAKSLFNEKEFKFLWVVEFPLFEWNEDENRWNACHHMFTMPKKEHIPLLTKDPGEVKGDLYDLVCNGVELASGSIRIHDSNIQKEVMKVIGMSDDELQSKFGFLLEAFKYGAPPHGGIAPGIDRLVSVMLGRENIKDVIAFPKSLNAMAIMEDAPSEVSDAQLKELNLKIVGAKDED